ncbi:hypothetical protein CAPTEDRAFT_121933, partial [Capitella teleta]
YFPDLAPSDYKRFGNMKNTIRGRHFASNNELIHGLLSRASGSKQSVLLTRH